jgi:hypothetical protein
MPLRSSLLLLLALVFTCRLSAQDLTGTWEGSAGSGADYLKMVIVKVGNRYAGYTYDTDRGGGYCRADFEASFNEKANKFKGSALRMFEMRGSHVLCNYSLYFSKVSDADWLSGNLRTKGVEKFLLNMGMNSAPVYLKRISRSIDTTSFMRTGIAAVQPRVPEVGPVVPKPASDNAVVSVAEQVKSEPVAAPLLLPKDPPASLLTLKKERRADIVQEITTKAPELKIRVFDNGVQDGDTVSILHNNLVVADHRLVAVKYFEFTIKLDDGNPVHEITLIAHNLGSIAPNTASLVIEAGEERYRLTASTDLERNAVIRIHYKP